MDKLPLEFKLKLKGKVVGYEKMIITGNLMQIEHFQSKTGGIDDYWRSHSFNGIDQKIWIPHDEKCQGTGFNDRNGEKIYFGDILTHPEHDGLKAKAQIYGGAIGAYDENYNYPYIWTSHQFENMELVKEKNNDIL